MILSAVFSALISSWLAIQWHEGRHESHDHREPQDEVFHQWLHEHLGLSDEQETVLAPIEKEFADQHKQLKDKRAIANQKLAHAIRDHDEESPEIETSLAEINDIQNELREVTLAHFFAMKKHLTPAQATKLREWTHDSITHEHTP